MTNTPTILLFDLVGLGLLVECPTGVVYKNQVGGLACLQREVRGVLCPLANDVFVPSLQLRSPEEELRAYFAGAPHDGAGATHGLSGSDADAIDAVLETWGLADSVTLDRQSLADSCEAWVHVTVLGDVPTKQPVLAGFQPYPRPGVLTWSNSD